MQFASYKWKNEIHVIAGYKLLTILKSSIIAVWQGPKYTSVRQSQHALSYLIVGGSEVSNYCFWEKSTTISTN